jgi:hypothetical protein
MDDASSMNEGEGSAQPSEERERFDEAPSCGRHAAA